MKDYLVLGAVLGVIVALILYFTGCGGALPAADDPDIVHLDAVLTKCRQEARSARDAGASSDGAYEAYATCKRREGVR